MFEILHRFLSPLREMGTAPAMWRAVWPAWRGTMVLAILCLLTPSPIPAQERVEAVDEAEGGRFAVVNLSVAFLREEPDYTAELGTQSLMGTVVEIVGEDGYWRQIITPEPYKAWCNALALTEMNTREIEEYRSAAKYICTAWHSTVLTSPKDGAEKLCDLVEGDILRQVPSANEKGKFRTVMLADGRTGYVPKSDLEDYGQWLAGRKPTAKNILDEAMKFVGVPYLWGGASPNGVDCSGLVRHVFMMNGISLPRNASQQARLGVPIPLTAASEESPADSTGFRAEGAAGQTGEGVSDREYAEWVGRLAAGDLVFFGSWKESGEPRVTHVGIYMGGGRMIHASQVVRINSIVPGEPDCYENVGRLLFARRILKGE